MIYALNGEDVPLPVRETIAQAILDNDANVLDAQEEAGTIVHVRTAPDPLGLSCIYCLDTLEVVDAASLFFRHSETRGCLGSDQYLDILNPRGHRWRPGHP